MADGPGPLVAVRHRSRHVELRVDGTLASSHDARHGTSGLVWQALALPILALPPARRRRLLVLGLGGASVARVARLLAPAAHIVGVEKSAEVVAAARAHLGLDGLGLEVVVADALAYLSREDRRFDVVIEDVFVGPARTVRKPEWLPAPGLDLAAARLLPGGVLVSNTIHETPGMARHLRSRRLALVEIAVAGYWNRILAAGPPALQARRLRAAAGRDPALAPALRALRFRTLRRGGG